MIVLSTFVFSCDKGLEELNKNKTSPTSVDPAFLLNNAVINSSFPVKSLVFDIGIVQQMVSPNGGVLAGANFNQDSRDVTIAPIWAVYYQNVLNILMMLFKIRKVFLPEAICIIWQGFTRLIHL